MGAEMPIYRSDTLLNILRFALAAGCAALLFILHGKIVDFGSAAVYAASWVTFLHLCVGEYVLVRYLHARSAIQNALDLFASAFLVAGILSFSSPELWCSFFGGLFAIAVIKYMLIIHRTRDPVLKKYAREKVQWEMPAVFGLVVLAVILDALPPASPASHLLQLGIFIATTAFAIWIIAIRHSYRQTIKRAKSSESFSAMSNSGQSSRST